jgi:hypothetical protein
MHTAPTRTARGIVRGLGSSIAVIIVFAATTGMASRQETKGHPLKFPLNSLSGLEVIHKGAEVATYRGRRAVRLLQSVDEDRSGETMAILTGSDFQDGAIEVKLAGAPRAGAPADIRGFVGIAFRVQPHALKYECFYVRMTNGRADDQLRRNHATQYISAPDYPWERLRKENPDVYESYVDLEPGAWTTVKIVVSGTEAKLYVNGTDQPCLIVHDLKLGKTRGQIALWIGPDTDAYFSGLTAG